jgi:bacillithiol biosynthesis cysteine-adding enzyme BshC
VANPSPSIAASRLPIDVRRLPWISQLTSDYTYAFTKLAPFFAGDPAEPAAWRAAIDRVQKAARPRDAIADAMVDQQRRQDAPPAAIAAAGHLRDARTVAIVTGQQAGLFGGPLYTLLKAVTALKLAANVRATHGVNVVPVFWIESEDHDWNEVASCWVLDREFGRRPITLPRLPGAGIVPVAAIRLDATADAAIQALRDALPPTDFTASLLDQLRGSYRSMATMPGAFGRWMLETLGPHGLVVYDASDPATKPLVRDLFAREIEQPGRTAATAADAGRELVARGYHAQVAANEDAVALFHLDGARTPIHRVADGLMVGTLRRSAHDLLKELDARPAAFSPNVLLRPLVQDSLFPTIAYVAGPNELAYLAQLRGVYERFNVPMPLMVPRASATLLDSAAVRFITKTGLPFEALRRDDEGALNRLLEQQLPPSVEGAWHDADAGVTERMDALIGVVPLIDPTLEGAARSTLGRMKHDLDVLHDKIVHAAKRHDETLRRQFGRTRALAFPGSEPQERAVGFVYFLNQYGPALVERLLAELPLDAGQHWVLSI